MNKVGQYIENLIKKGKYSQSDVARGIGVQRQLLSYVISGRRSLSLSLALKLESFFNLPEGELLKMQAADNVHNYKCKLKEELIEHLIEVNAFWSYEGVSVESVSDEELMEKTFINLDMRDIATLFELYTRDYVRKVWRERMAIQGDYLFNLNVMIALYYFDIKQPEKYLRRVEHEYIKQLSYA